MAGTHTTKAMLTFTAAELKTLVLALDMLRGYADTAAEGEAMDALTKRIERAMVAVTPR